MTPFEDVRLCQHDTYYEVVGRVLYLRCRQCEAWAGSPHEVPISLPPWAVRIECPDAS